MNSEFTNNSQSQLLSEAIDIGYLDLNDAKFFASSGGFVGLNYKDTEYSRVTLKRALPINHPDEYISVSDASNNEIGIIKDINDLKDEQRSLLLEELSKRYYCPKIDKILSVKDKMGFVYFDVSIIKGNAMFKKNCSVKDVSKNIRMLGDDKLMIFDVDGNRFLIDPLSELDKKSKKFLEPYIF